jgi:hypothetical protein
VLTAIFIDISKPYSRQNNYDAKDLICPLQPKIAKKVQKTTW